VDSAYPLIIAASLACGLTAGYVMHRADFCVTAMFRDAFLFRDFFLLRMLVPLVAASALLFELGRAAGLLTPYPFPLLGAPALTNVFGGFVFGVGMVLAGGCVVGSLYKFGAGSLVSGVALLGMLIGAAFYAEIHSDWSALTAASRVGDSQTLAQAIGVAPAWPLLPALLLALWLIWRWWRAGLLTRVSHAAGHIQPWRAALILAGVGFVSWSLVGMPLGITTSYVKLGASLEALIWPEHVRGLAYFSSLPLDYVPPFSDHAIRGGPGPALDAVAAVQYPLIAGIILGAAGSALRARELRLAWRAPARQYASALAGGILLGLAARLVPACNVWHLWGGLPILALQSLLFLIGLIPGTWLGSRLLTRYVVR
jgi:uncharacterized membrane protein YedE/YeeE